MLVKNVLHQRKLFDDMELLVRTDCVLRLRQRLEVMKRVPLRGSHMTRLFPMGSVGGERTLACAC
jgi:hypothetical protein